MATITADTIPSFQTITISQNKNTCPILHQNKNAYYETARDLFNKTTWTIARIAYTAKDLFNKTTWAVACVVARIVYYYFSGPISKGIGFGIFFLVMDAFVMTIFCDILGMKDIRDINKALNTPNPTATYTEKIVSVITGGLIFPVVEEVIFRGIIQSAVKWVAIKILPDIKVTILPHIKTTILSNIKINIISHQIHIAALVASVVTGILFGIMHGINSWNPIYIVSISISGILFGILKEQFGFLSAVAAHIFNNSLIEWPVLDVFD